MFKPEVLVPTKTASELMFRHEIMSYFGITSPATVGEIMESDLGDTLRGTLTDYWDALPQAREARDLINAGRDYTFALTGIDYKVGQS